MRTDESSSSPFIVSWSVLFAPPVECACLYIRREAMNTVILDNTRGPRYVFGDRIMIACCFINLAASPTPAGARRGTRFIDADPPYSKAASLHAYSTWMVYGARNYVVSEVRQCSTSLQHI